MGGWLRAGRLGVVLLACLPAGLPATSAGDGGRIQALPEPRALSAAERAAVELAAGYLQRGAAAWWQRLAAGAPLRRLGRASALEEIAVRAGPADGATWQLLTPGPSFDRQTAVFGIELASGLDETLVLHLVDEGGWKLSALRASFDPIPPRAALLATHGPAAVAESPAASPRPTLPGSLLALALPGVLLAGVRRRSLVLGLAAALAILAATGWGFWIWVRDSQPAASPRPPPAAASADSESGRLGGLKPLRIALAAGSDRAEIERRLAERAKSPKLRRVQDLWRAQYRLLEADLTAVGEILGGFPSPSDLPLADLLHARLAFRRLQREETGAAYQRVIRPGFDDDILRLESALAESLTDQGDLAAVEIEDLAKMGSRLSEAWYGAAEIAVIHGQMEDAEGLLRRAWRLTPATRAELFGNPVLAFLVARPSLFPLFQLGVPEEAHPAPAGPLQPLAAPAGTQAATCGEALRLTLGGAELLVPLGAQMAPAGAAVEDAGAWSRHDEAKALAALPSLTAGAVPGETLPPRRLRLAEQAGHALAEQNRWQELLDLTAPLVSDVERTPASLVRLRAQALRQLEHEEEARQLLVRLAKTDLAGRRPAPGTLFDLAELFAAAGEYDTAIRLSKKADSQLPEPRGQRRRKQLALDRDLTLSYASFRSAHFEVRYPKATGETYARGVTLVLEEERRRLARWIPLAGKKPIEVHLFPIRDFMENYGGDVGVVGLFDGKVRVPFAEIRSLHPKLLAILSHELAHALIAAATHDRAPHWLQEGLAEHIEMGLGRLNPLPDLARTGRALSFPTLDAILRGFAEPQLIDLAYSESAWTVQFIEARFGVAAIHRLLAAFAAGQTTEQALATVCHLSTADFDRALWQWGTTQAPASRSVEVRRYDQEYASLLHEEHAQKVQSILRVGISPAGRDEAARRQAENDERRRRMASWHAGYAARAAGVKRALKPIVQRYRQGVSVDILPACDELAAGTSRMLDDASLWDSPDRDVNQTLRNAYRRLAELATACQTGRDNEIAHFLVESERALAEAAQLLAPYNLLP